MTKLRWGVIGAGGIADRRTIPGMMLADNAELIAVMDTNQDAAERCKEKYGARYAFDRAEDLLSLKEIQAVYMCFLLIRVQKKVNGIKERQMPFIRI